MLSRSTISAVAGAAAIGFLGYCVYFDRKRRSDPNFKKMLRERRRQAKMSSGGSSSGGMQIPDLKDTEAMQRFFLQEVQLGEELLAAGDIDSGVDHLSNAVAVCGQPQQLLSVLQQTLPAQVFQMLIQRMPQASQRIMSASSSSGSSPQPAAAPPASLDLDLE